MLVQFSVENFLSIKERNTLCMVASKDMELDLNYFSSKGLANNKILKTAVIYGANASGKTNILKAIKFFSEFIINNHKIQKGDKINVTPFKLNKFNLNKPSYFEVIFIHRGVKYVYGFSVDKTKVYEEFLYYYPKGRPSTIFQRKGKEYYFTQDKEEQSILSKRTLENRLYLSTATEWNYEKTARPFQWFKNNIEIKLEKENPIWLDYTRELVQNNIEMKRLIRNLISVADLGIYDINISEEVISPEDLPKDLPEDLRNLLISSDAKKIEIKTLHWGVDKNNNKIKVEFSLREESQGTRKMFELVGYWLSALKNGHLIVIDELDTSLHPHLVEALISLFHDPLQNTKNAQLIFTTHDTNLLNLRLFRRDQIWFTEKDSKSGATDLYSLVELQVRKDENIKKGYLAGRYGAIPFLGGGLRFWPDPPEKKSNL